MERDIKAVVTDYLIKQGKNEGISEIAEANNKGIRTIKRWLYEGFPDPRSVYVTAVKCGISDDEALALAKREFSTERRRESA